LEPASDFLTKEMLLGLSKNFQILRKLMAACTFFFFFAREEQNSKKKKKKEKKKKTCTVCFYLF
jgi:hypothetical protein